ncbi:sensory box histidine kinase/response regulator [hydrothermal vent metagenome]|uniref:histidine kinase n=1 Tax=hydrothermal vent metagenome TaxID=652676 RepID=A0A3B1C9L3_9ZZZZ
MFNRLSQSPDGSAKPTSSSRFYPVAIFVCVGLLLSLISFFLVNIWETERITINFKLAAQTRTAAIKEKVHENLQALALLGEFFRASKRKVERDEFSNFARPVLHHRSGIQALEWAPRVSLQLRNRYEGAVRYEGFPEFTFKDESQDGGMVTSPDRPEYFPVYYVEPLNGNEMEMGFDLGSNQKRLEAINHSRDTGKVIATSRVKLVQEPADQFSTLLFLPVYRNGASIQTISQKQANLEGFILAVFRIGDLLESSLGPIDPGGVDIHIFDESAQADEAFLYFHSSRVRTEPATRMSYNEAKTIKGVFLKDSINIGERSWLILATPTDTYISSGKTKKAYGVLLAGIILTVASSFFMFRTLNRPSDAGVFLEKPYLSYGIDTSLLIGAVILLLVGVLSWKALDEIKDETKRDLGNRLQTTLNSTQDALHLWSDNHINDVDSFTQRPDVRALIQAQLGLARRGGALKGSKPLYKLREIFQPFLSKRGYLGFFVVSHNLINVASTRDDNIGKINLLAGRDDYLDRMFKGEPLLTLPVRSEIVLPTVEGDMASNEPTMFAGAPVYDDSGQVIATFIIRLDPTLHFTRIFHAGRTGTAGDQYAFNKDGVFVTESKFTDQLRRIGLLKQNERASLSLSLRNPGGNMLDDFRPDINRKNLPFTKMAQHAIAGESGTDLDGYLDYRGVPVVGTWVWDDKLGCGLAYEIDHVEAFSSFYNTRTIVIITLVTTVLLFISLSVLLIRRQRETAASQQRFITVFTSAADGIITINEIGLIQWFNPAAEKMFGYDTVGIVGRNISCLMPEPYASSHDGYLNSYLETGVKKVVGHRREVIGKRKDGSTFPLAMDIQEMWIAGKRYFTGILQDITERKQAEKQLLEARHTAELTAEKLQQTLLVSEKLREDADKAKESAEGANRAKSEFLSSMSHEIRTPINAIIGMADLIGSTKLTKEQAEYVDIFKTAGGNLLNIINDVLDLSKIEAGHLDLEMINFDLDDLVEKAGKIMAIRAHERGLELTHHIKPGTASKLIGDSGRLLQILINLLGNAVKFTEKGEIALMVETQSKTEKSATLLFTVSDTGIGISEDKKQAIFKSFTQADSSTTRKYGGTGLGLSISQNLIKKKGGKIWLESELGKGSTFFFTATFGLQSKQERVDEQPEHLADINGLNVLVVDDNSTNRLILKETLHSWGANATLVESGAKALETLTEAVDSSSPFDLLLLDWHMPNMDGLDVIKAIRDNGKCEQTTIIMLTSDDLELHISQIEQHGMAAYLMKPIMRSALFNTIVNALDRPMDMESDNENDPDSGKLEEGVRPLNILLAEDDPVNQRVARIMLEKQNHHVTTVGNGALAVSEAAKGVYDLVLMDINMPIMDGYQATRKIRENEKKLGVHLPIVAMTALAFSEDTKNCMEAGMDAYILKPVQRNLLYSTINDLCSAIEPLSERAETADDMLRWGGAEVFNHAEALERAGGDIDLLSQMAEAFVEHTGKLMPKIKDSIANLESDALMKGVHAIKGSSATMGAMRVAMIARKLEKAGEAGDYSNAEQHYELLEKELKLFNAELTEYLEG